MDCDSKIEKETKCILAEWRVDLKFWCQMHFFGYPFDVQVQPFSIKVKGHKNGIAYCFNLHL